MKKDMTEGREWSSILLFSLPIMGANLLQVLYNLADSVIVGNLISATALGAVGLTSSMIWLLTAICTSIGAGVNIAVAQYFGAKKETDIQESISVSYLIAIIASIFLTAACFLAARPVIFGFLQAPEEMRFDSMAYFLIYSGGIIFQLLYNVTYGILRAHGDSRGALIFLMISAALNIVLDCVFISIFHMGVSGAAAATVIAQAGSAIASFLYLRHIFPDLLPKRRYLYAWKGQGALLMRLSIPIMLQTGVNSIGFLILQRLINSFGAPSIEGYAAMLKVEQLAHIPSQSFNVAISSFAGQNIGAEKLDRARRGYRTTILMGVLISISISIVVLLFDRPASPDLQHHRRVPAARKGTSRHPDVLHLDQHDHQHHLRFSAGSRRCQDPGSFRLHQPGHPPRALLPAGAHPGWLPLLLCEHAARMADRLLRSCDALPEWKMEGVSDCKRVKKRDGRIHFGG